VEKWSAIRSHRRSTPNRVLRGYEVHWQIGSAPVGGIIEVLEFDEACDLAWVSIIGLNLRGRFRLCDAGPDGIRVTFWLSYQAPGGLLGLIAGRIGARQVGRVLQPSLANVRAMVGP
jgi:uncharacterized membrane protein